jgi:RNA polymerase primary sigma factor
MLENAQPIHIPTYMVELINHWRHTAATLQTKLGREPMLEEMADEMKMSIKKAVAIRDIAETVEPNAQTEELDPFTQINNDLTDQNIPSPHDAICNEEEITKALKSLEKIDEREAQVLKLRFGLTGNQPLTLKQIGKKLKLTRERIRQIQRSALANLQELMTEQDQ